MGLKLERAVEIANKFPDTNNAALARLLFKENRVLYKNEEDARSSIRLARGSHGIKDKKNIKTIADVQRKFPNGVVYNPYQLPDQEHHDNRYFSLGVNKDTVIGLLSDIHIPYQDNQALTVALDHCKKAKVTHLILNGDVMDCYQISRFEKDPSKRSFKYELDTVRAFLTTLADRFKGVRIIFKEGNHENRYMRFMRSKAPELLGIEAFNLSVLLGLKQLGIDHVPDNKLIQAGNLIIIHGHEFGQQIFSPVNPARGYFLKAKTNVIGGHNHQVSAHSENRLDGKQIVAYSTGHLADPNPEYKPINNWSHGFAIITHIQDGKNVNFNVHNHKIINQKIY